MRNEVRASMGSDEFVLGILETWGGKERDFTHAMRNLSFSTSPK